MCHPLGDYRIAAGSRIYSLGLLNANLVRVLYLDKIGQRQNEYRGRVSTAAFSAAAPAAFRQLSRVKSSVRKYGSGL